MTNIKLFKSCRHGLFDFEVCIANPRSRFFQLVTWITRKMAAPITHVRTYACMYVPLIIFTEVLLLLLLLLRFCCFCFGLFRCPWMMPLCLFFLNSAKFLSFSFFPSSSTSSSGRKADKRTHVQGLFCGAGRLYIQISQ